MTKLLKKSVLAALLIASISPASATVFTFDYSYDGENVTPITTAYGSNMQVGDTVKATYRAVDGYWVNSAGYIFATIAMNEPALRTGNVSWNFYNSYALVSSQTKLDSLASSVHILGFTEVPVGLTFDILKVDYTVTNSTSSGNHFANFFEIDAKLTQGNIFAREVQEVPEPASLALLGLGLLGLAVARSRKTER